MNTTAPTPKTPTTAEKAAPFHTTGDEFREILRHAWPFSAARRAERARRRATDDVWARTS